MKTKKTLKKEASPSPGPKTRTEFFVREIGLETIVRICELSESLVPRSIEIDLLRQLIRIPPHSDENI